MMLFKNLYLHVSVSQHTTIYRGICLKFNNSHFFGPHSYFDILPPSPSTYATEAYQAFLTVASFPVNVPRVRNLRISVFDISGIVIIIVYIVCPIICILLYLNSTALYVAIQT